MNSELEREALEVTLISTFGYTKDELHFVDGEYIDPDVQDMYLVWKAGRAALSTEAQPEVTGDWVMVPREPTIAMLEKLTQEWHPDRQRPFRERYKAMLSAAPSAPSAIEAAVREKLERAVDIVMQGGTAEGIARRIRALMESPHPKENEA